MTTGICDHSGRSASNQQSHQRDPKPDRTHSSGERQGPGRQRRDEQDPHEHQGDTTDSDASKDATQCSPRPDITLSRFHATHTPRIQRGEPSARQVPGTGACAVRFRAPDRGTPPQFGHMYRITCSVLFSVVATAKRVGTRDWHLSVAPARSRVIFVPFRPGLGFVGRVGGEGGAPRWTNDLDPDTNHVIVSRWERNDGSGHVMAVLLVLVGLSDSLVVCGRSRLVWVLDPSFVGRRHDGRWGVPRVGCGRVILMRPGTGLVSSSAM
jgi:hypothetical protein